MAIYLSHKHCLMIISFAMVSSLVSRLHLCYETFLSPRVLICPFLYPVHIPLKSTLFLIFRVRERGLPCRSSSLLLWVSIVPCISIRIIQILVCRREVNISFIPSLKYVPSTLLNTQLKAPTNTENEHY